MDDSLDSETEAGLARAARTGDRGARDQLIRSGLRWVAMHAARLGFIGVEYDDAVQDGCLGLIDAVDRFDPERGVRLVSFAWPWIEGAMRRGRKRGHEAATVVLTETTEVADETSQRSSLITSPDDEVIRLRFGFHDGRVWTRAEVADRLGWSPAQVRHHEARVLSHLRARVANIGLRAHA